MTESPGIASLIKQAAELLPAGAANLRQDFERNLRPLVEKKLSELNLVTREEFDQRLAQLERLEAQVAELEAALESLRENN